MAVKKRGKVYYLRIRPFDGKLINIKTMAQSKAEATKIERAVLTALGAGDYRGLDPVSREACVRIFRTNLGKYPRICQTISLRETHSVEGYGTLHEVPRDQK